MSEYDNYGDINPLQHGGIWVKQLNAEEFDIIKYEPELNEIYDLQVNINDSWIEREKIMSYIGMEEFNPIKFAIGCVEYYSPDNFGTTYEMQEVINFLKARGIEC